MITDGLNERQKEAVDALDGVVMVSAGAGSGKTKVLTYRVAALLEKGVPGGDILAITFTNKAAKEMRARVENMTGKSGVTICTFHALCGRILRQEIAYLPKYTKKFTIFDTATQERACKNVLKEMNWDNSPANLLPWISWLKENGFTVNRWEHQCDELDPSPAYLRQKKLEFYKLYQEKLESNNAMDFDDLLLNVVTLFRNNPDVRDVYRYKYRYIMVDEYQDTNHIQYELIKLLFSGNLCVVGDADQSIYGWRGADEHNIIDFDIDFPGRKLILLEQNYRSTKEILDVANSVIANNANRVDKRLWTSRTDGIPVQFKRFPRGIDEAEAIVSAIRDLSVSGVSYNDIAILYRMNSQSRQFEESLTRAHIPYMVLGGVRFYERKEIKDTLAYLTLMVNPYNTEALTRALKYPARGIGDKVIEAGMKYAKEHKMTLFDALSNPWELDLPEKKKQTLDNFFTTLFECAGEDDVGVQVFSVVDLFKIRQRIIKDESKKNESQAEERLQSLDEFIGYAKTFMQDTNVEHNLESFLEQVALFSDADTENRTAGVSLMTVHAAKGLEFENVFLPGLEDNIFPTYRALTALPEEKSEQMIQEERRLFYVAVTRAKTRLYLSCAENRMLFGKYAENEPSMFLPETALV